MKPSRTPSVGHFALALALIVALPGAIGAAHAATFVVDSTEDLVDLAPGNGVCLAANERCTLRAAVMEANALPGADVVRLTIFDTPHTLTIAGANENLGMTGDLDITDDLSILFNLRFSGPPQFPVIDGGGLDRVFDVRFGATTHIQGVIVRNGFVGPGGGAGILNQATLTLFGTIVTENLSLFNGGGILNGAGATLTVTNSTISDNIAADAGGGIYTSLQSAATLVNSTVSGNTGQVGGSGIAVHLTGVLTLFNSTVTGNSHSFDSGSGIHTLGSASVVNSTISGNADLGLWNEGTLTLVNSTVTGQPIGAYNAPAGTTWLANTIVGGNPGVDCVGRMNSAGYNLDSDTSCLTTNPVANDLAGVNPLLGPLAGNGGPTLTHALLAGSPAINAANNAVCLSMDQRGAARPQGGVCDIGAYEAGTGSYMAAKDFQVRIQSSEGESADCLRFEADGTAMTGVLGSGSWRELGLFGLAMWWTAELTDPRGRMVSLLGSGLVNRQLFAFGVDSAGVSYWITGVEAPGCRAR